MSLYNMVCGMNAGLAVVLSPFLPMAADSFPRFRDVFLADEQMPQYDGLIHVYTRMGGGNRECWEDGVEDCTCPACTADKIECVARYDDDFDRTYCTFVFSAPEEMATDFEAVSAGRFADTSPEYRTRLRDMFAGREQVGEFIESLFAAKDAD